MIQKERDPREHADGDTFALAGAAAEEQMAFYLRRAFVDDPKVYVFHDLRFKDETGDTAQIDHLVLHPHGIILIESKSVSTGVAVNKLGEWVRFWNNRPQGMPSPIQQAKRQIEFLRRCLSANSEKLLTQKMLGILQARFRNFPFEIIVAISDRGTIKREIELPEVVKADQVPDRVREIIARHKKARLLFSIPNMKSMDGVYNLASVEMDNIARFLTEHHYPSYNKVTSSPPDTAQTNRALEHVPGMSMAVKESEAAYAARNQVQSEGLGICDSCGQQCSIKWGRYGYYWKCAHCDNNMAIKEYCPLCRQKVKLRKDRNRFSKYCDVCKTPEELYCEFETV